MRYDLQFLMEFCRESGLAADTTDPSTLEVDLGNGAVLCFQNAEREEDCLMGFLGTPWHAHGDLTFADPRGHYIELDPLNLLSGLQVGQVLVCESRTEGTLVDRWLIHSQYNEEFGLLRPGEAITILRADTVNAVARKAGE